MQPNISQISFAIVIVSIVFFILATIIALVMILHNKKVLRLRLEQNLMQTKFEQVLAETQVEIQEETLKKISEEIHDNIGQKLSSAKTSLATIDTTQNIEFDEKIKIAKTQIGEAIQHLRDISKSFNSDAIADMGLANALKHELEIIKKMGIDAQLTVFGFAENPNPKVKLILFRIIQESIHNVLKHAKAKNLFINLNYVSNGLEIIVKDDGIGFNDSTISNSSKGIGIINIKNRCKAIDANLVIESQLNKGTQIKIIAKNISKQTIKNDKN